MRSQWLNAVVIAGLMIAASLALPWLGSLGVIPGDRAELTHRGFNVMLGLLVVGMANLAPKRMKPLAEMSCEPGREQASRRFSSVVIVIGGLLYCLAWIAAPIDLALPLSVAGLAGSLTVVLAQCVVLRARRTS